MNSRNGGSCAIIYNDSLPYYFTLYWSNGVSIGVNFSLDEIDSIMVLPGSGVEVTM